MFSNALTASFWYFEDEIDFEKIPSVLALIEDYKRNPTINTHDAAILDKLAHLLTITNRKENLRFLSEKLENIEQETIESTPALPKDKDMKKYILSILLPPKIVALEKAMKRINNFIEKGKIYNIWTLNAALKLLQGGLVFLSEDFATLSTEIRHNILENLYSLGLIKIDKPNLDYDSVLAVNEIIEKKPEATRLLLASSHTDSYGNVKRESDLVWNKEASTGAEIIGDINDQSILRSIPDNRFAIIVDNSNFGHDWISKETFAQLYRILISGGEFYLNGTDKDDFSRKEHATSELAAKLLTAGFELIIGNEPISEGAYTDVSYAIAYEEKSGNRYHIVGGRKKSF
jgi:hypothetical protein